MSYSYIKSFLKDKISNAADKKVAAFYRQHQTALNNLVNKYEILSESNVPTGLTDDLEETLSKYQSALMQAGTVDVRSPKSKVRRLSELYIKEAQVFNAETTFSEIVANSLQQMYGDELWTGKISVHTQADIKKSHVTYYSIATDIVLSGRNVIPNPFPKIDWNVYDEEINSPPKGRVSLKNVPGAHSQVTGIKEILAGERFPTVASSKLMIRHLENFLGLPKETLIDRLIDKSKGNLNQLMENKRLSRAEALKSLEQDQDEDKKKKKYKFRSGVIINNSLRTFYNEYSDFKINGTQPEIKNVSEDEYENSEFRLKVSESKPWTVGISGKSETKAQMMNSLKFFQSYCVQILKISLDDVNTSHLTNPSLIEKMCIWCRNNKYGMVSAKFILNLCVRCCRSRGFLRLSGDMGDRNIKKFRIECNHIVNEYNENLKIFKQRSRSEKSVGGKSNIKFLLEMPVEERRSLINRADALLIEEAEQYIKNTSTNVKKFTSGASISARTMIPVCTAIKDAYFSSMVAMINEVSFTCALRANNLISLHYASSEAAKVKLLGYPTLTYHRKVNRYYLDIPLEGAAIDKDSTEIVRYFKNSDVEDTTPVSVLLPEYLSSVISKFLKARKLYLDVYMTYHSRRNFDKVMNSINELNDIDDLPEKELILNIYEKEALALKNFNSENIKLLFPYLTRTMHKLEKVIISAKSDPEQLLHYNVRKTNFMMSVHSLGLYYKDRTYSAYYTIDPEIDQEGVNIHATRHIAVTTHLHNNPGDFYGAAAILNDKIDQVIKTYGEKDRVATMQRLGNVEHPALAI